MNPSLHSHPHQIAEKRRYLGGTAEQSILIKGLDYALLAQRKAELDAKDEQEFEDALEDALGSGSGLTSGPSESQVKDGKGKGKMSRDDLVKELKRKREMEAGRTREEEEDDEDVMGVGFSKKAKKQAVVVEEPKVVSLGSKVRRWPPCFLPSSRLIERVLDYFVVQIDLSEESGSSGGGGRKAKEEKEEEEARPYPRCCTHHRHPSSIGTRAIHGTGRAARHRILLLYPPFRSTKNRSTGRGGTRNRGHLWRCRGVRSQHRLRLGFGGRRGRSRVISTGGREACRGASGGEEEPREVV